MWTPYNTAMSNTSFAKNVIFVRKIIKRTYWRLTNLSRKQFFLEFVLRRFTTVRLDASPEYHFTPLDQGKFAKVMLPDTPEFFVMIKPSGLPREHDIKRLISQAHFHISHEEVYHNFFELAFHIFHIDKIHDYRHHLPEGYLWLKLLKHFYPAHCHTAKILYIRNGSEAGLKRLKTRIRKEVGVEFFQVHVGNLKMVTCMTPVHTSDLATLEYELRVLRYFKKPKSRS